MDSTYEKLILLRNYWKQNFKATTAMKKINDVEGEGFTNVRTAQKWLNRHDFEAPSFADNLRVLVVGLVLSSSTRVVDLKTSGRPEPSLRLKSMFHS